MQYLPFIVQIINLALEASEGEIDKWFYSLPPELRDAILAVLEEVLKILKTPPEGQP